MVLDDLIFDEQLVYDFYMVYMDIDIINVKGIVLLMLIIEEINNINLVDVLIIFFGKSWLYGINLLFWGGLGYN